MKQLSRNVGVLEVDRVNMWFFYQPIWSLVSTRISPKSSLWTAYHVQHTRLKFLIISTDVNTWQQQQSFQCPVRQSLQTGSVLCTAQYTTAKTHHLWYDTFQQSYSLFDSYFSHHLRSHSLLRLPCQLPTSATSNFFDAHILSIKARQVSRDALPSNQV